MNESGIDLLIKKVKSEGIQKARDEAAEIIKEAQCHAQKIIEEAKEQAQKIHDENALYMERQRNTMDEELRLAARDFTAQLESNLREKLYFPIIQKNVRASLREPDFLKSILQKLALEFVTDKQKSLEVLVPNELKVSLAAYFAGSTFDNLEKKCQVKLIGNDVDGFMLRREGEHYYFDFNASDIANELAKLVEPKLRKYFSPPKNKMVMPVSDEIRA